MNRNLAIFPIVLFLTLILPGSVSAASTTAVNINDVISISRAKGSPLGDCIGPDKKHLQTTKEVCETLNKAWGKGSGSFNIGVVIITAPATVSDAIALAKDKNLPTGDCTGPDKKHFEAAKEVCEALNKSWGKTVVAFTPGASISQTSTNITKLISEAEKKDKPKGDCVGPDKKHFETSKEVCEAVNHAWGKTAATFSPDTSTSSGGSGSSNSSVNSDGNSKNSVSTGSTSTNKGSDKTEDKGKKSNDKSKKQNQ